MNPPSSRNPLSTRPVNINNINIAANTTSSSATVPVSLGKFAKGNKGTISEEILPDFKAAIEGKDLTKLAMIEALKKQ
jgi:chromatin assembly factor 1 subunit A